VKKQDKIRESSGRMVVPAWSQQKDAKGGQKTQGLGGRIRSENGIMKPLDRVWPGAQGSRKIKRGGP